MAKLPEGIVRQTKFAISELRNALEEIENFSGSNEMSLSGEAQDYLRLAREHSRIARETVSQVESLLRSIKLD